MLTERWRQGNSRNQNNWNYDPAHHPGTVDTSHEPEAVIPSSEPALWLFPPLNWSCPLLLWLWSCGPCLWTWKGSHRLELELWSLLWGRSGVPSCLLELWLFPRSLKLWSSPVSWSCGPFLWTGVVVPSFLFCKTKVLQRCRGELQNSITRVTFLWSFF